MSLRLTTGLCLEMHIDGATSIDQLIRIYKFSLLVLSCLFTSIFKNVVLFTFFFISKTFINLSFKVKQRIFYLFFLTYYIIIRIY